MKVFRPNIGGVSIDNNITSKVFQDSLMNYWFTSNSALHSIAFGNDSIRSWQFSPDGNSYHYAFHLQKGRYLWMIADRQLYIVDTYLPITAPKPILNFDTYSAYGIEDHKGNVNYLIGRAGRNRLEIINFKQDFILRDTLNFNQIDPGVKISSFLYVEAPNCIWIPTSIGLMKINPKIPPKEWGIFKHKGFRTPDSYKDVAKWGDKFLWVASKESGLLLFDLKSKSFLRQDSIFFYNNQFSKIKLINRIEVDKMENLWFSIFDQGIFSMNLKNRKFDHISLEDPITNSKNLGIHSIVESKKSQIFIQTYSNGIFPLDSKLKFIDLSSKQGFFSDRQINNFFIDPKGSKWVLTEKEILKWNDRENFLASTKISLNRPLNIFYLSKNHLLAIDNNQIYSFTKDKSKPLKFSKKVLYSDVYLPNKSFFDSDSRLVFLSQDDNTLNIFKVGSTFKKLKTITNVGIINSFFPSLNGRIVWLAGSAGLFRFDKENLKVSKEIAFENRLNQSFTGVVEDSLGQLWLSSYNGIHRFDRLNRQVQHFTQSDGLITMEYTENSKLYSSNGKIYFGGDRGVSVINPKDIKLNDNLPEIQLLEFQVNNKVVNKNAFFDSNNSINLTHDQNLLEFKFAVIEYSDSNLNQLRYFLVKNNKDTINIGNNKDIQFNLLKPGNYRLDLIAANSDGIWTKKAKRYAFRILPPWYQTWWAKIMWGAILTSSFIVLYKYRVSQIRKKESYKRKEAEFKQKEAEFKQLAAETETAILRLQMNPHFIFNSMNSISSYLLQKDIDTANDYLQRFAQLMRMILELSEQSFTDVTEEIELLELYLEAEALRLGKKLDFRFEISPKIDPDNVLLPTMILQPFVENAIWHGISPKNGLGTIYIRFKTTNNQLICEVEDNGVGRTYYSDNNKRNHNPKALSIIQRRLNMININQENQSHYLIEDLVDTYGAPIGTKVKLFLPIIK